MAEYIACRSCDSHDCKGCNLKRLETMLANGKFECLMDENRGINTLADVAPVRHGHWIMKKTSAGASYTVCSHCNASVKYNDEYGTVVMNLKGANYCPNCGANMEGGDGNDDAE